MHKGLDHILKLASLNTGNIQKYSLQIFSKFGPYTITYKYLKENPESVNILYNLLDNKDNTIR